MERWGGTVSLLMMGDKQAHGPGALYVTGRPNGPRLKRRPTTSS